MAWPERKATDLSGSSGSAHALWDFYLLMRKHGRGLREVLVPPSRLKTGGYHPTPEGWKGNKSWLSHVCAISGALDKRIKRIDMKIETRKLGQPFA